MPKLPKQYYRELYSNITEDQYSEVISNVETPRADSCLPNRATPIKRYDPGGKSSYECLPCTKMDYKDLNTAITTEISQESITVSFTDDDTYSKSFCSNREPFTSNVNNGYSPNRTSPIKKFDTGKKSRNIYNTKNSTITAKVSQESITVLFKDDDNYSKSFYSDKKPCVTNSCLPNPTNRYDPKEKLKYEGLSKTKKVYKDSNSIIKTVVSQESITVSITNDDTEDDTYSKPSCLNEPPCTKNATKSYPPKPNIPYKKRYSEEKSNYEYLPITRNNGKSKNSISTTKVSQESVTISFTSDGTYTKPFCLDKERYTTGATKSCPPKRAIPNKRYDPREKLKYDCLPKPRSVCKNKNSTVTTEISQDSITVSFTNDDIYSKYSVLNKEPCTSNKKPDPEGKLVYECLPYKNNFRACINSTLETEVSPELITNDGTYSKPFGLNKGPRTTSVPKSCPPKRAIPNKKYDSGEKLNYDHLPKPKNDIKHKNSIVTTEISQESIIVSFTNDDTYCSNKKPYTSNKKHSPERKSVYQCLPYNNNFRACINSTLKTEASQESTTDVDTCDEKPICSNKKTSRDSSNIKSINITKSSSSVKLMRNVSSILKNLNIQKAKNSSGCDKNCTSAKTNALNYKRPRSAVASILKDMEFSQMRKTDSEKSVNSLFLDCASTTSNKARNKCRSDLDDELKDIVKRYTTDSQVNNVFDYGRERSSPKKKEKECKIKEKTAKHISKEESRKGHKKKTPKTVKSVTSADLTDTDNASSTGKYNRMLLSLKNIIPLFSDMVARQKPAECSRSRKASVNLPQNQRKERYPSNYYINEKFRSSSSTMDPNLQLVPELNDLLLKKTHPRMPEPDYCSSLAVASSLTSSYRQRERGKNKNTGIKWSQDNFKITVEKPVPTVNSRTVTEDELMEELERSRKSKKDHRSKERKKSPREYDTRLSVQKPRPVVYSTTIKTDEELEELESQYHQKRKDPRRKSRGRSREHLDNDRVVYAETLTPGQLEKLQKEVSTDSKEKRKKKPLLTTSFGMIVVEDPNAAVCKKEPQRKPSGKKANFYLPQDAPNVTCYEASKPSTDEPSGPSEVIKIHSQSVSVQVDEDGTTKERRSSQSVESQTVFSKESHTGSTQTGEEEKKKPSTDKKDARKKSKERPVVKKRYFKLRFLISFFLGFRSCSCG